MKKVFIISLVLWITTAGFAQQPVKWTYSAKKISNVVYEVHLTATIEEGWHLYAQKQPEDAIALPTAIVFAKNPLLVLTEPVKEIGQLEQYKDATLGITAYQYAEKVDFVKTVKLKAKVKTNTSGSIRFQVCTDERCLLPAKVNFSIALGG